MAALLVSSRRDWMRTVAGALAASATHAAGRTGHWAMLSDTHISAERDGATRGFKPYGNLERAAAAILDAKPEGCVVTGDLARLQGTPGDYVQLQSALKPLVKMPVGLCLGNHDDRENFNAAFGGSSSGEAQQVRNKNVLVIPAPPVRFVLLDSLIVANETPGFLGKAQRTWLDKYLETSDATPVMLFVHHTLDDEDGSLLDSDRLLRLAAKHRKVKAIFYGHSHRYSYDTYEGLHLVNLPATGYNFNEKQPIGWVDARLTTEGAELTLRALGGNTAEDGKTKSLAWRE